jgi:Domain of unknown function (DUF5666)
MNAWCTTGRKWAVWAASAVLVACGGGDSGMAALPGTGGTGTPLLPGTGGTGIFALGPITGFGSVWVNGVRYDDSTASVLLDGVAASSAELRVGMVAGLQGTRDAATLVGTARQVAVWSIARGAVQSVSADRIQVAGMTVLADAATTFDGVASLALLTPGTRVAVWGLQSGASGQTWLASRVQVLGSAETSAWVSTGPAVLSSGGAVSVGGVLLNGLTAPPSAGLVVRASGVLNATGTQAQSGSWVAYDVLASDPSMAGEAEIEGVVSLVNAAAQTIVVGAQTVSVASAVREPSGAVVAVGQRVEAEGVWKSGVLVASKLEIKGTATAGKVEVEAVIEQFTSLADFVVRGQRCDASGAALAGVSVSALKLGAKVHLKGVKDGDWLRVTELEIEIDDD